MSRRTCSVCAHVCRRGAVGFMGDARLVMLIRVAAFAFILFPFTAVFRGISKACMI